MATIASLYAAASQSADLFAQFARASEQLHEQFSSLSALVDQLDRFARCIPEVRLQSAPPAMVWPDPFAR